MPEFESVQLPADGAGKQLATKISSAQGPGGADVHLEVNIAQPDNAIGHVLASQPLAELPLVLTSVFTASVALEYLFICNPTGANVTVQITDGSGTPVEMIPDTILPAKAFWAFRLGGIELLGGLKWKASDSGVNGALKGYTAA